MKSLPVHADKILAHLLAVILLVVSFTGVAFCATYEVGPGFDFQSMAEVPWDRLEPGDMVLVHWRLQPYHEK